MVKELSKRHQGKCRLPGLIATKFHDDFTKDEIREMVAEKRLKKRGKRKKWRMSGLFSVRQQLVRERSHFDINGGLAFS